MRTSSFVVLLAIGLVFSSCKKDSTNPAGTAPTINGTWTITSATVNGQPADPAQIFEYVQDAVSARFTFGADGRFTYEEMDAQGRTLYRQTGTFAVNGQSVTITITEENGQPLQQPVILSGTWAITGNQLTFTTQIQGNTVVLVFTRVS
jgi:hypothetical protein